MKKELIYLLSFILISCSSSDGNDDSSTPPNEQNSTWLIPVSEVKDGGPGKDGIPSIENPIFIEAQSLDPTFLNDNDLVIGVIENGIVKAYPHRVLDWHEIVNDKIDGNNTTISYCPLTGTAFRWKGTVNSTYTTFGVSGLLYNANLILYDRISDSYWSQLKLQCVSGEHIGDFPEIQPMVETTWKTWKTIYPNSLVLTNETGFDRNYKTYPYGPYRTDNDYFIFEVSPLDNTLPSKQRVHAIIDPVEGVEINSTLVYTFNTFNGGRAITDNLHTKKYLVVGNETVIQSFELTAEFQNLTFEYSFTNNQEFFKDNEGNKWSIFGEAIEGPRQGEKLQLTKSVTGFWFAIAAFYPEPRIYVN